MTEGDTFFSAMVHCDAWQPDKETGQFFIDRDPLFVREILQYLRNGILDGKLPVLNKEHKPHSQSFLGQQLDFFQVSSLLSSFNNEPAPAAPPKPKPEVKFVCFMACSKALQGLPSKQHIATWNEFSTGVEGLSEDDTNHSTVYFPQTNEQLRYIPSGCRMIPKNVVWSSALSTELSADWDKSMVLVVTTI
eukprot:TRINITY_DN76707_c0_g1_i1.p1 TRINITY_DN76707_c0_g1~~TRINITY_DN76707_c0_g1_i1.p1  ORF type:complete len:191 (-),score=12.42 TRINITY_DN76707_c0_g1_i1:39-611(-)